MARELHAFDVTIPAGTLKGAPQVTNLTFPPREVTDIEVIIPPGPRGTVGFQLGAAGNQILPYEPGSFLVSDNETIHWPVSGQITSGAWQCRAYNTGKYDHTLEFRFLCDLVADPVPAPPPLLAPAALGPAPDTGPAATATPPAQPAASPGSLATLGFALPSGV